MQTCSKGFPLVEMRGGIEVRRLRGACLETCWKEKAVAKERAQQPTSFRFQPSKCAAWEERADTDVLSLVWPAAESTCNDLERLGYAVCYAQSTYARTDKAVENTPQTRSQSGFSVDLTLKVGAYEIWLETGGATLRTCAHLRSKLAKNSASTRRQRPKQNVSQSGGSWTTTWEGCF